MPDDHNSRAPVNDDGLYVGRSHIETEPRFGDRLPVACVIPPGADMPVPECPGLTIADDPENEPSPVSPPASYATVPATSKSNQPIGPSPHVMLEPAPHCQLPSLHTSASPVSHACPITGVPSTGQLSAGSSTVPSQSLSTVSHRSRLSCAPGTPVVANMFITDARGAYPYTTTSSTRPSASPVSAGPIMTYWPDTTTGNTPLSSRRPLTYRFTTASPPSGSHVTPMWVQIPFGRCGATGTDSDLLPDRTINRSFSRPAHSSDPAS